MFLPVLLSFILMQGVAPEQDQDVATDLCRDRSGLYPPTKFNHMTCAACYGYLFPTGKEMAPYKDYLVAINSSQLPLYTTIQADHTNQSVRALVCHSLDDDECQRWVSCCTDAASCCTHQLAATSHDVTACPSTWDGYACWDETEAGQEGTTGCPAFIPHAVPSVKATKICGANGTWYKNPATQLEWTNYTRCTDTGSGVTTQCGKHYILIALALSHLLIAQM